MEQSVIAITEIQTKDYLFEKLKFILVFISYIFFSEETRLSNGIPVVYLHYDFYKLILLLWKIGNLIVPQVLIHLVDFLLLSPGDLNDLIHTHVEFILLISCEYFECRFSNFKKWSKTLLNKIGKDLNLNKIAWRYEFILLTQSCKYLASIKCVVVRFFKIFPALFDPREESSQW